MNLLSLHKPRLSCSVAFLILSSIGLPTDKRMIAETSARVKRESGARARNVRRTQRAAYVYARQEGIGRACLVVCCIELFTWLWVVISVVNKSMSAVGIGRLYIVSWLWH